MAKKDFTASPLMNFITPSEAPAEAAEELKPAAAIRDTPQPETPTESPRQIEQTAADQTGAAHPRKTPEDNCITPADQRAAIARHNAQFRAAPPTPPEYRASEDPQESRSRRMQLLVKPSIFQEIRKVAHWKRQSVNNLMEEIIIEYLNTHDKRGRKV